MNDRNLWKEEFRIKSYEVDMKGKVTLPALCNYFQEAAGNHADALERGMDFMLEKNQTWVLSRFLIKIQTLPEWNETVVVETWSKGVDGLFALRDFSLLDREGTVLGAATSGWLVMDRESKRPQRLDRFLTKWPFAPDRHALDEKLERIAGLALEQGSPSFRVRVSDLDINKHVNNVKYIEWIMDSYDLDFRSGREIASFEINYLAEAFFQEEMAISREQVSREGDTYLNTVLRKSDGKEICRARTAWKKASEDKGMS